MWGFHYVDQAPNSMGSLCATETTSDKLDAILGSLKRMEDNNLVQVKKGKVDVVLGAQWGDEGKGKLVDILSGQYDICARVAGGSNAGHTIVVNVSCIIFHDDFIVYLYGLINYDCRAKSLSFI